MFVPMVYQMIAPTPSDDLLAIDLFLKNRDQKVLDVRKLWIGGPSVWEGRGVYQQTGRPYRVMARDAEGKAWRHYLAVGVGERDALGSLKVKQRVLGQWLPVIQ